MKKVIVVCICVAMAGVVYAADMAVKKDNMSKDNMTTSTMDNSSKMAPKK